MVLPSKIIQGLVIEDAKFNCIKEAAQYYAQALEEGRLDEFLDAVQRVYIDQWPEDGDIDLGKV